MNETSWDQKETETRFLRADWGGLSHPWCHLPRVCKKNQSVFNFLEDSSQAFCSSFLSHPREHFIENKVPKAMAATAYRETTLGKATQHKLGRGQTMQTAQGELYRGDFSLLSICLAGCPHTTWYSLHKLQVKCKTGLTEIAQILQVNNNGISPCVAGSPGTRIRTEDLHSRL